MTKLKTIILVAFILRATAFVFTGGYSNNYYWEYGETAKNLLNGNGYSLFYYSNSVLEHHFNNEAKPYPSAYMSPGYVFFLYPFITIKSLLIRNILLFLAQTVFSIAALLLLYKITEDIFNYKTALLAAFFYAVTPDIVYAVVSYTPTAIYHFLVCLLFYLILSNRQSGVKIFIIALIFAASIYFRTEFFLFLLFFVAYLFTQKRLKDSAIVFFTVIVLLLPWTIRNYNVFDKPLFSTGTGINIYRGNNKFDIGVWGDEKVFEKLKTLKGKNFEAKMSDYYSSEAADFIKNNPLEFGVNLLKKFYAFWGITFSRQPLDLVYQLSWFIILLSFIYGAAKTYSWQRFKFFYMFFIISTIIIMVFFPLPRYQTMMKFLMFPFCAYAILQLTDKIKKNKSKFLQLFYFNQ